MDSGAVLQFDYDLDVEVEDFPTDVSKYLSGVKRELELGEQVFHSKRHKSARVPDAIEVEVDVKKVDLKFRLWAEEFAVKFELQRSKWLSEEFLEPVSFTTPETFTGWRGYMVNTVPTKSLLNSLDHSTIMKLVTYLKKLITKSPKGHINLWATGLFLRLTDVLNYNEIHELRQLSNRLITLRLQADVSLDTQVVCLMIIAIVFEKYGQRDLYVRL